MSPRSRPPEIAAMVRAAYGGALRQPKQPRFHFVEAMCAVPPGSAPPGAEVAASGLRLIYAPYGDLLMRPDPDPYPGGFLARLQVAGVNSVWLHAVLRAPAPIPLFPEFSDGHKRRLATLRDLGGASGATRLVGVQLSE